ncbi:MAG: hypothetical protein WCJ30_10915 [Deltaproteobacteria bacterium]
METTSPHDVPRLEVLVDELPGVIELRASGVVTLPELREAYATLAKTRERRSDLRIMLLDAEHVTRFGRGAVVEAARWITRNAHYFDLAVTVTRSPSLKSAALALSACAPKLRHVVVNERTEALERLRGGPIAMSA